MENQGVGLAIIGIIGLSKRLVRIDLRLDGERARG